MCVQCLPRIWKTLLIVSLPTRMRSGMPSTNMRPLWCVSSRFDQRRRGAHSSCRTQSEICDVQRVVGQNSKLVVHREISTSCRNDYKRHLIATKAEYCCTMVDEAGRYMKKLFDVTNILLGRTTPTQFPNSTDGVPPWTFQHILCWHYFADYMPNWCTCWTYSDRISIWHCFGWHETHIGTPLHTRRGLDTNNFANYRPVSNIGFVSKVLERYVSNAVREHVDNNDYNDAFQSAYRPRHSTETALVRMHNVMMQSMDCRRGVLLVPLDSVPVTSGVPQGSV